jgi:CubicO group peptidase (beta-lactamase class C family)
MLDSNHERGDRVPTTAPPVPRSRTGPAVTVTVCALLALAAGLALRPVPSRLPAGHAGDAALAALAREVVGEDRPALAVAAVTPHDTRTAVIGADPGDRFEVGSISKALTALLFADMIERGEVRPDTRVGDLVAVGGPVADVTLAQLATHHSGLPSQPPTPGRFLRNWWASLTAGNPYGATAAERIASLDGIALDAPPATYSNAGFELLGAALAAAAGTPYPQLLTERVLAPLGMRDTAVPVAASDLGPRDIEGETAGGRRASAWVGEAIAPAGGVRAGAGDLAILARALLTGQAPGRDAVTPKAPFDEERGERIGWAWFTTPAPGSGRPVVWHNGGTGGFTAFLGVDTEAQVGVVVLSAVGEGPNHVTAAGFTLLERLADAR